MSTYNLQYILFPIDGLYTMLERLSIYFSRDVDSDDQRIKVQMDQYHIPFITKSFQKATLKGILNGF